MRGNAQFLTQLMNERGIASKKILASMGEEFVIGICLYLLEIYGFICDFIYFGVESLQEVGIAGATPPSIKGNFF